MSLPFPRVISLVSCSSTSILPKLNINSNGYNFKRLFSDQKSCADSKIEKPKDTPTCVKTAADTKKEKPADNRVFKVYRFDGADNIGKPRIDSYNLDVSKIGMMVLDALMVMKTMDPTLNFRRSCREGICGSCSVNVQGKNVLACISYIPKSKTIHIYPLPHMYVIRDLIVDMTHFYDGFNSIRPYLIRKDQTMEQFGKNQYAQSIADNELLVGLYECVLCACCSTSCPSYWWNGRRFLGPATLIHAYRWVVDSRDGDTYNRLRDLRDDFKVFRCHSIFQCTLSCPKGLHPGAHIQKLKLLIAGLDKKKLPDIEPMKFLASADG